MTTACTDCVRLVARVAELEQQLTEARCGLEEVTAYAAQQHDRVSELTTQIVFLTTGRSAHEGTYG